MNTFITPQRSCHSILVLPVFNFHCAVQSHLAEISSKKKKKERKRCTCLIFRALSPQNSCFTNSSDSKKNKPCQFCRMCSFLFTASGGKKRSDALKHDGKRYPSKNASAEKKPLSFTLDGQSCINLNRIVDAHSHRYILLIQCISVAHSPDLAPAFGGEGRWGNKQHRGQVNVNSSHHQEAITAL